MVLQKVRKQGKILSLGIIFSVCSRRILFLVSLLFVALWDIGHKDYNNHSGAHTYKILQAFTYVHNNGLSTGAY